MTKENKDDTMQNWLIDIDGSKTLSLFINS